MKRPLRRQRGVVLLFALIALLILMIGAAALVRSFNTSLFQAGNIGFKRDLQNRNDAVTSVALQAFKTGALKDRPSRSATSQAANYSATILSVDRQGIPDVLTRSDRTDQTPGAATAFVLLAANDFSVGDVAVTYVIDRLCAAAGDEKVLGPSQCATVKTVPLGADTKNLQNSDTQTALGAGVQSSAPIYVLYRVSARITGPRNTVSFFQSTIAVPS